MVLTIRDSTSVDSDCWHSPAAVGSHGLNTETLRARQHYPAARLINDFGWLDSKSDTVSPAPAGSPQVVPDPATTAVLVQGAAFNQCAEMLLQRIATGARQLDDLAHRDTAMLAGELDNLQ